MIGRQLTQWMLVLGVTACTADASRPPGANPSDSLGPVGTSSSGASTSTTVTTGSTTGSGGAASRDAQPNDADLGNGGSSDAGPLVDERGQDATDSIDFADAPRPVIHDDAPWIPVECPGNRATLGTNQLMAGGSTPSSFATAYNAELATLHGSGPLLIVLSGVNDPVPAGWIASFGALDADEAGLGVGFAGKHADVAFSMNDARAVRIAPTTADFEIVFAPPASDAAIPIGSIELAGSLNPGCGSLVITRAKLLVPTTAGDIAFHGSTIKDLMGAPTESYDGMDAGAWPLELAGTARQVYAPGVLDDGGIGR